MKKLLIMGLCLLSSHIFAKEDLEFSCIGMNPSGTSVHLLTDFKDDSFIINQDIWKIAKYTKMGIVTKSYLTTMGTLAYNILLFPKNSNKEFHLDQLNAVTNEIMVIIPLACHKE